MLSSFNANNITPIISQTYPRFQTTFEMGNHISWLWVYLGMKEPLQKEYQSMKKDKKRKIKQYTRCHIWLEISHIMVHYGKIIQYLSALDRFHCIQCVHFSTSPFGRIAYAKGGKWPVPGTWAVDDGVSAKAGFIVKYALLFRLVA